MINSQNSRARADAEGTPRAGLGGFVAGLSLRKRLLLLLVFAALPGIVVAIILAVLRLQEQTEQIELSVERLARLGAAQHEQVIESARTLLEAVAREHAVDGIAGAGCATYLSGWVDRYRAFTSLTLFSEQGKVICSNRSRASDLPTISGNRDWLEKARTRNDFVLGDYALGKSGKPIVVAARPVLATDGRLLGFVALGIELSWLDFVASNVELPINGTITAIDREGVVLSHNRAAARDDDDGGIETAPPAAAARREMGRLGNGTIRAADANGSPRVYGFQNTRTGSVVVAVGLPRFIEYLRYGEALLHTLLAPLAIILLALIATAWASEILVTRHVRKLTRTADAIAGGDLSARSDVPYEEHEIGRLAQSFDEMASEIETQAGSLRDLAEEREVLLREMNHRVKNNMQVILAMLQTERRQADSPAAGERLAALAGRIRTLADIHRLLHEQAGEEETGIERYASEMARLLTEFYDSQDERLRVRAEVEDVPLSLDQAVSFGMVLNELVSNAQKHAFPDGREGTITVRVERERGDGRDLVHLSVADDGVGLPEEASQEQDGRGSTGMRIVHALVRQLDGELTFEPLDRGTAVHLRFAVAPPPNGGADAD